MRAYSLRDYLQWNTHYNGYITVGRVSGNPPDRGQRWANNTGEPLPLRSEATEEGTGPALTEDRMIQDSLTVLSPSDAIRGAWRTSPASLSSYDPESCRAFCRQNTAGSKRRGGLLMWSVRAGLWRQSRVECRGQTEDAQLPPSLHGPLHGTVFSSGPPETENCQQTIIAAGPNTSTWKVKIALEVT